MIAKCISVSEQVNDLSDFAALLFSWLIPHADDYGILPGSAKKIKALVIPMRKQTPDQVEIALKEIQTAKLIWRYIYNDQEYLQFCSWEDHQDIHKRTSSKNPLYLEINGDSENFREIPGNSFTTKPNLTKENLIKEKITKEKYADNVSMKIDDYQKLVNEHGSEAVDRMIEILENYKGSSGKKYASDYKAILTWVVKRYQEEQGQQKLFTTQQPKTLAQKTEEAKERYALRHGTATSNGNKRDIPLIQERY